MNFKKPAYNITLIGRPNVGKSSIFNMLSAKYIDISNYHGTTVSITTAKTKFGILTDAPGIYGLTNLRAEDERITIDLLSKSNIILNVVGALTLERDLLITWKLIKSGFRIILIINQIDEAEKNGIFINEQKLSQLLNVQVIKTIASKQIGKKEILFAIKEEIGQQKDHAPTEIEMNSDYEYSKNNIDFIKNILEQITTFSKTQQDNFTNITNKLLLTPFTGWLIALAILYLLFKFLAVIISGNIVDSLCLLFDEVCAPSLHRFILSIIKEESVLKHIFIGEFGILTMGLKTVFAILLPLITGYNMIMSLLEDSGYIPRLSILTDNLLKKVGINGKAIIPILLGFGCSAMGILSNRILENKKDKMIATAIMAIAIPCAAQQGIIISLLSTTKDIKIWIIYVIAIVTVVTIAGKVINKIIPGKSEGLMLDIPPLRIPSMNNYMKKTFFRSVNFVKETGMMFTITCIIVTLLNDFNILEGLQNFAQPLVVNILKLPKEFVVIFVMGIIRRDMAAAGVLNMFNFDFVSISNNVQILVATIVITLFVPCINALIIILREYGWKYAIALWVTSFFFATFTGAIVANVVPLLIT